MKHSLIIEAVACGVEGSPTPDGDQIKLHRNWAISLDETQLIDFLSPTDPEMPRIDGGVAFVDAIPKTRVRITVPCMITQVDRTISPHLMICYRSCAMPAPGKFSRNARMAARMGLARPLKLLAGRSILSYLGHFEKTYFFAN